MQNIIESNRGKISCTLSCYDRILIRGILPEISYAAGMTEYLYNKHIKIFDYANFAESHKSVINKTIEEPAKKSGAQMGHINKGGVRKESLISSILEKRGTHPGIVHVISTPEWCTTYKPWHDKTTGKANRMS
jgi:hypothetical protein